MPLIIGITHSFENGFVKLNTDYLKAVSSFKDEKSLDDCDVINLVLTYSEHTENITEILKIVDGIVLSGGGDLSELVLSEKLSPKAKNIFPERDIFESELCKKAYAMNIPLLGVCRGLQIMNVALDGKIRQHIEGHNLVNINPQLKNSEDNALLVADSDNQNINKKNNLNNNSSISRNPPISAMHEIIVDKNSRLFEVMELSKQYDTSVKMKVNSYHHQCISKVSPKLSVGAICTDSVVEAVESKEKDFFIGVQFHPEKMPENNFCKNIFKNFLVACKAHKSEKNKS